MKTLILVVLLAFSATASAFTQPELVALKAAVQADQSAAQCYATGEDGCVLSFLNSESTFVVWKTSVSAEQVMSSPEFAWTRVDNLTNGKARIWDWMIRGSSGTFNPSNANIRAGIDAVWVGTAADLAVRAGVYDTCKRVATVAEKTLATGTGTTQTPGILTFEGSVSMQDILAIRGI